MSKKHKDKASSDTVVEKDTGPAEEVDILSPEAEALASEIEDLAKKVSSVDDQHKKEKPVLKPSRKKPQKHTMPVVFRVLFSAILLMILSVLFTWFIFWRHLECDGEATAEFIQNKPDIFAYSLMVIFILMTVIAAATWRIFFTIGISFSLVSIITYIDMQKMRVRSAPLLPDDFQLADQTGELIQFVDVWGIVRLIGGVILIMFACIMLEHYARRIIGRNTRQYPKSLKVMIMPRVAFASVALAAMTMLVSPVIQQRNLEWVDGMSLVGWNQTDNYDTNGFVIGFLYNLGRFQMTEPEGYSADAMQAIAEKYQNLKESDPVVRLPLSDIADNVIVILDETFYDPELLTKYYSHRGGDPLPNLRKIFRDYPSGYMYSPEYGGGTANVEFEVQTGLTNYWAPSSPYVNAVPKTTGLLGVAAWAKKFGFETTAIHSYDGTMYKRNLVYPLIGYDDFIDEAEMKYPERENDSYYYNDRSVYNEILDILQNSDTPQMIGAVTMQNHAPFWAAHYPKLDYPIINIQYDDLAASFQSLHYADKYLGEFLEALDKLDEKTVVLWFGDHAAGILNAYVQSEDKTDRDIAHLTPYFIYANFDIKSEYTVAEVFAANAALGFKDVLKNTKDINLPVTTPNCLQNTMYDILDAEKPALFYLVDEVCENTPILSLAYLGNNLTTTGLLKEYELVNYDMLNGKHYWDGE